MAQSSKVRPISNKEAALEEAAELEAEARYRIGLARNGQPAHVDLGAAAGGMGARRLIEKAERLRAQAAA
jgi:hypothetical protein